MAPDLRTLIERTARLRATSARAPSSEALVAEIEDALCAGYAEALSGDAWSMRAELRLRGLADGILTAASVQELRRVTRENARFRRDLAALRHELAELQHSRDRLRAALPVPSP